MRKSYRRLSAEERVQIATLRSQNFTLPQIARVLGRHRSTVWREVRRNRAPHDGWYRSVRAHERAIARRKGSRRHQHFTRPYRPQTNGKAGRLIQTMTREWAYTRSYDSSDQRATFLPHCLPDYNLLRPHSALGRRPLASRLPKTADNLLTYNS